ncbi:TetR/AcrR family transcriptional regulator [Streptomyces sp. NPDC012751]|uniref:TetR/AcrR family transcriptional regulator n=1 Tax=Streptomyces sp. NPDC012751 TaxID=3364846 RepID=UPI0036B1BB74
MLAAQGPPAATAEEIARHAGVALRTFYRCFRSGHDVVSPLLADGADRWRAPPEAAEPGAGLFPALRKPSASRRRPGPPRRRASGARAPRPRRPSAVRAGSRAGWTPCGRTTDEGTGGGPARPPMAVRSPLTVPPPLPRSIVSGCPYGDQQSEARRNGRGSVWGRGLPCPRCPRCRRRTWSCRRRAAAPTSSTR